MVEAVLFHRSLSGPAPDGKRYFWMTYSAVNFNTATITISDGLTNDIFAAANQIVFIEGISIDVNGFAAAVKGHTMLASNQNIIYFPVFTTSNAVDSAIFSPKLGISKTELIARGTYPSWFAIYDLSGYAATDDILISVWGWIDSSEIPTAPTAVSLEGYKWPLVRR